MPLDTFGHSLCNVPANYDLTGKIALIDRGVCQFSQKALNAQTLGAVAVVIVNFDNTLVNMAPGDFGAQVTIPVIIIMNDLGQGLIQQINQGETILASIAHHPVDLAIVEGLLRFDENSSCTADASETGLGGWQIKAHNLDNNATYYATTRTDGSYTLPTQLGASVVSVVPPAIYWDICTNDVTVNFTQYETTDLDFLANASIACPILNVDIETPLLRRCFPNYFNTTYCNIGSATAEGAYITVHFDELFTLVNTSVPYTDLGNGDYQFDLGDVAVGACGSIFIETELSCDAQLGETFCAVAQAYPSEPCVLPLSSWSGANIVVEGHCNGTDVVFDLKNTGTGDMPGNSNYRALRNGLLVKDGQFDLAAGASQSFEFPADGSTYRMEADQVPDHPVLTLPSKTLEGCSTNGVFSTGFFNMFPAADYGDTYDEECNTVIGSWDPNDKTGFPLGYGPKHYIERGTDLEYLIRFQNTGTDTAFNIVVRDTIDSDVLDLATLRPGSSSFPYTLNILDGNVLVFRFDQIMLPDSFVNEPASHGYLNLRISPKADLPLGTIIRNSAAIYFDFNEPVITNTYFHEIGENFIVSANTQVFRPGLEVAIAPNPMSEKAVFDLGETKFRRGTLELMDATGRHISAQPFDGPRFEVGRSGLAKGSYPFRILLDNELAASGVLVVQ